jgi:hypothetical protein
MCPKNDHNQGEHVMSNCDTQTGHCSTSGAAHAPSRSQESCCAVEKSLQDSCCPVEKSAEMWQKAFFCAMKEASTDILKEKIRKAWGPVLEKEADAVVEAMGVHWRSILAQAQAQKSLKESLAKIQQSAQK